jgi:hypothetical protein
MKPVNILLILTLIFMVACNSSNTNNNATPAEQQDVVIVQDFENAVDGLPNWNGVRTVFMTDSTQTHSGNYVSLMNDTMEYSLAYNEKLTNINSEVPNSVDVEGWLKSITTMPNVSIIMDIKDAEGKSKAWRSYDVDSAINEAGSWKSVKWSTNLSNVDLDKEDNIKIFVWNKSKKEVMLDDLTITFKF